MTALATENQSVGEYLDSLAAGESTPGGGAAAALTAGQAAALLSMVVNFTVGRRKFAAVEEEMRRCLRNTEELRADLLALADRDAEAFGAVSACYAMPRSTGEERAARGEAMQAALKGAAEVPFQIAERCVDLLELTPAVAGKGNANVVSDAAAAAHLAYSALHCSLVNVRINLKFLKDDSFIDDGNHRAAGLSAAAERAYSTARAACQETLGITI